MSTVDFKTIRDIVDKFIKYDTMSEPPRVNTLSYEVPKISGITKKQWGKNIEEVQLSTIKYIVYYLHHIDESKVESALMALLYYWKVRKKKICIMREVYQEVLQHYEAQNQPYEYYIDSRKAECIYLVKISIGSKKLYKVGTSSDIHQRMKSLQSDIRKSYPLVSIGIKVLKAKYTREAEILEEEILEEMKQLLTEKDRHKFNFKGSTEAFITTDLISVFNLCTDRYMRLVA